uniref:Uncharacterized protein n=1 Tax=Triticum urartu TaxID=4572 RepID=A0A8R7PE00_TRIUA
MPAPAYIAPRTPTSMLKPSSQHRITIKPCRKTGEATISSCCIGDSKCDPSNTFKKGMALRRNRCLVQ